MSNCSEAEAVPAGTRSNAPRAEGAKKIRVVVVDDSALIRRILSEIINRQADMEVVGTASNPLLARELIKKTDPDVITLDVEMPQMDGLDFLDRLMRLRPTPVIMISSLTAEGSEAALRALELGAVDYVAKPGQDLRAGMLDYAELIADKIRTASRARVRRHEPQTTPTKGLVLKRPDVAQKKFIIVGASTGGTEAISEFLRPLPADCPPILITQHMPEQFTMLFANRLNKYCPMHVKEAEHGERVQPGYAYIAPGHAHLLLEKRGPNYYTALSDAPPVNRHRPSVDVLFESAARTAGRDCLGVILTGMGRDGAAGMLQMRQAGAYNLAQDEASCVVYGMPRAAWELGAAQESLPLGQIPARIVSRLNEL